MEQETISVYMHGNMVMIDTPGGTVTLEPPVAVEVAEALISCASDCGYKVEVVVPKRTISSALRAVLIARIARVIQSQRNDDIDSMRSSMSVVDTILAEIL
jgi:hypothetical protein